MQFATQVAGMNGILVHIVAAAFVLLAVAGSPPIYAQEMPSSPPAPGEAAFSPEELDQLLAPIALYPDALLGQILMAATYPLEVVQAARWVGDPDNAALKGDALTAALANEDWDPSVKSLVPFPQVLSMMDTYLDWMQKLGDAFLAQEADVMTAVQRLRRSAQAAGTLTSTDQQEIVSEGQTIVIEPANPEVIYVPVYNPTIVYGVWPYPAYPPYYFPPPPGYIVEPSVVTDFYFAAGIVTVQWLWGWDRCDWHHHRIDIDDRRFNVINVHRPPIRNNVWVHDSYHRRGVPYPNPAVRGRFERSRPGEPETLREFRGYVQGEPTARPATPPRGQVPRESPPRTIVPRTPLPRRAPPRTTEPRTGPPAFQGYSNGTEVRRDAERGRESRRTMAPGELAPRRNVTPSRGGQAPRPGGEPRRGGFRRRETR
jgi:Protein of unknown function (DUF3300)